LNTINFRAPRELPIIYSLRNLNNNNNENVASITSLEVNEKNGLNNSTLLNNEIKATSLPVNLDDTLLSGQNDNDLIQYDKNNKFTSNDTLLVNSSIKNDLLPPTSNTTTVISLSTVNEQKHCELDDEKKEENIDI